MKRFEKKKSTLADKIADVLNTAPKELGSDEEEGADDTSAKLLPAHEVEESQDEEELLSKFRKQTVDLLGDIDEKYAGRKSNRKALQDSEEGEDESDSSYSEINQRNEEEASDEEDQSGEEIDSNNEEDESEADIDEEESFDDAEANVDEEDDQFKHLDDSDVPSQIKKATSVRNQMAMWEHLLEARIQLQKCLVVSNKLPNHSHFKEIKQESGSEFSNKVAEVKGTLTNLLNKFMYLQHSLLDQYPETKNLTKKGTRDADGDVSDEEIPSDTDPEESAKEEDQQDSKEPPKKKRKLQDYENDISTQHEQYKEYRNSVIQKWNDKTRLFVKNGVASNSVIDQIEYALNNRDKLIKKTQLKRSEYSILGQEKSTNDEENIGHEYNAEIFDDDDFYHQLLRELIEFKSADVTDPIQLGRQWIQLQSMRSKMKRKIDTKATKGRKIRYAVHSKLVNFMAPMELGSYTEDATKELFSSLFGKNQPIFSK